MGTLDKSQTLELFVGLFGTKVTTFFPIRHNFGRRFGGHLVLNRRRCRTRDPRWSRFGPQSVRNHGQHRR